MNKNDLKNGMKLISRNGKIEYIIENNIYRKEYKNRLELEYDLDSLKRCFNEDISYEPNTEFDVIKVFDSDNDLIWEREEIDWTKVPVNTKVLVRNSKDEEWYKRYFAEYKDGIFYTFNNGGTSWSISGKTSWKECKLAEETKENITPEELKKSFNNMCYSHKCDGCDYDGRNCQFQWLIKNYNITKKE